MKHRAGPITALAVLATALGTVTAEAATLYQPILPCRVFDTREVATQTTGAPLPNPGPHTFRVQGNCGVPDGALGATFNVTITQPTAAGDLRLYPEDQVPTLTDPSTLNYPAGATLANAAVLPLSTVAVPADDDLKILIGMIGSGTVHVILDVTGYFKTIAAGTGLNAVETSTSFTLEMLADFALPQGCATDDIIEWDGDSWECIAPPVSSGGDITSVAGGVGLTETPTAPNTGDVTVDLDVPFQLPQTCANGQVPVLDTSTTPDSWVCGGAPGGGGFGFTKNDLYVVQDNSTIPPGASSISVACDDASDIPLNGSCRPVPSNPSDVTLLAFNENNWDSTVTAASFTCRYNNNLGVTSNNIQTRIVCVCVPPLATTNCP